MHPFDIAQAFIEACTLRHDNNDVQDAFGHAITALGFRHFAVCSHVDPLNPPSGAMVVSNYPAQWIKVYSNRRLDRVDPVFRYAGRTTRPFFWDDPAFLQTLTPEQKNILNEAASLGIAHGYTIPIHAPGALPASCSLVPDSPDIEAANYSAVRLMAAYLHEALQPALLSRDIAVLSRRERECLELVGQGKSDWAIGQILGISERTVHNHVERAKQRLGVASRTQAVVEALFQHQISFGDVIRAEGRSDNLPLSEGAALKQV